MISRPGDSQLVSISLRVYRVLLAFYPQSFRQEYAPHMLQAFGDYTRRVYLQRGWAGMLWWWTFTFFDFAKSVLEEHLQRITNMTKEKFIRLGGWALMLAGLIMLFAFFWNRSFAVAFGPSEAYQSFVNSIWPILSLFYGIAFITIRSKYRGQLGTLGKFSLLAGIVFAFLTFATSIITFVLTGTVITANISNSLNMFAVRLIAYYYFVNQIVLMLFGIDAFNKRYLPSWWPLPLIAGLIPVFNFILQSSLNVWPRALWPLYRILAFTPAIYGLGTLLIGYMLQRKITVENTA